MNPSQINQLKEKTVIITGASRGIGEAAADYLGKLGCHVVLCARNAKALSIITERIVHAGGKAIAVEADVSQYEAMQNVVNQAVTQFGKVHILVNNAGVIDPVARLDESDPAEWSRVVDINLKGVYFALRAVLPEMLRCGEGRIVNISSGAATNALEGWSHYCATKAAVLSLTKCVDKEYGGQGITTIGLSPGTVATEMQVIIKQSGVNPVSQLDPSVHIPASDVAQAIAWLCTDDAKHLAGTDFSLRGVEARALIGLSD